MPFKDVEYKKKYDKEWRVKNQSRVLDYRKARHAENPWLSHYMNAKQRCGNPGIKCYKHYGGRGIRMLLTMLETELLYKRDHANKMEHPSIDRINPNGDYHFGNCRFIEQSENCRRQYGNMETQ